MKSTRADIQIWFLRYCVFPRNEIENKGNGNGEEKHPLLWLGKHIFANTESITKAFAAKYENLWQIWICEFADCCDWNRVIIAQIWEFVTNMNLRICR